MVCVNEKWIWENVRMWSLLFCVLFVWYSFPSTPCLVFPIFHCFYFYSNFNLPLTLSLQNLFSFSLMVETSTLCFLPIDFSLQRTLLVYLLIHFLSQILNFSFICPSCPLRFAVKASSISHFSSSPLQMEFRSQILNAYGGGLQWLEARSCGG